MFYARDAITPRGPTIVVRIGVATRFLRALRSVGIDVHGATDAKLLIDTGATRSAFKTAVFDKLRIPQHDVTDIRTPTTEKPEERPTFLVDLGFDRTHVLRDLVVIGLDFQGQDIDGVLGCDVLAHCKFTYSGIHKSWELEFHAPPYGD